MKTGNTMHCLALTLALVPGTLVAADPARPKTLTVEQAIEW